ncbi:MAG: SusC/RagA family TonB-linked outer membrane protein [Bacteroidota bacterium]
MSLLLRKASCFFNLLCFASKYGVLFFWLNALIVAFSFVSAHTVQAQNADQQKQTVSGKVISQSNSQPLPGVSISVKGTVRGMVTDMTGAYTIEVASGEILVFSFIGYNTIEVSVGKQTEVNITLVEDITTLNGITVISDGYQNVNNRNFTGSAARVKADDIKIDGVVDANRMMQGRVAGVSVQNVSGTFGAAPKIRVRGATSISGDNKPLWVVDGIVLEDVVNVSADQLSTGNPNTLLGSSVAGLNVNDIESFNILRDAAATALYGARAKDGVIVITTKKGKVGTPIISYSGNFSSSLKPTYGSYNIMNSRDQMAVYAEMERKGWLNYADVSRAADGGVYRKMYDLISNYDATTNQFGLANTQEAKAGFLSRYAQANTNWFDILFHNSFIQEHSLSMQSGTEASQFYVSGSYYQDNGWTIADNVKRYTANMRANFNINKKLTLGLTTVGSIRDQRVPGTLERKENPVEGSYDRDFDINPYSYAINTSRTLTAYDENGNRESFTRNFAPFNILNEVENNYMQIKQVDLKLQGDVSYKITKDINYNFVGAVRYVKSSSEQNVRENSNLANAFRAAASSTIRQANRFLYTDPDNPDAQPIVVLPRGGFYNRTENQLISYYLRNQLSWNSSFSTLHAVTVTAAQEIRNADRQNAFNNGYGYQFERGGVPFTDYRIIKQLLEGNFNYFGMGQTYERYASYFANAKYTFRDKYIFSATGRMDGSNRLGASRQARWLPTWNVSGAWNVDMEPFMKNRAYLDFLTIRASYGLTANTGNATNSSLVLKNVSTRRPYLDEIESAIRIDALENSELTWEKQYELNVGISTGLFKRLTITADFYQRKQFDLISAIRTSGIGGEILKTANYANMKSKGLDLSIGVSILKGDLLNWSSNLIFSYTKNEITNLRNTPNIFDLVKPEGGATLGGPVRGLFSIPYAQLESSSGSPLFTNEEGVISGNVYLQSQEVGQLKYEGSVDPTITGGFNNTFSYKNISLNIFITYQAGNKIRLSPVFKNRYTDLDAMPREFLDRWTLAGDEKATSIPSILDARYFSRLSSAYPYNNYNYSSARVVNGDYVRLRSIVLAYKLPTTFLQTIGFKTASISLTGSNLWLIYSDRRLEGQDPEFFAAGGVALPVPKQVVASLKLGF